MPRFDFIAYNQSGVRQSGARMSDSAEELKKNLEDSGLHVVSVKETASDDSLNHLFQSSKLTLADIEFFTSEIALLLNSGLRIERGLKILQQNVEKQKLRDLISSILSDLKQGKALSESLSEFAVFDNLYISLVKIAEETGELKATFNRLAEELKFRTALRGKIQQALVYPGVILTVCILAIVFIFNFVVPNLNSLFDESQELPLYTEVLLGLSEFFINYQLHMLSAVLVAAVVLWQYRDSPSLKQWLSKINERTPVLKKANLLVERIRFSSATATMLASGVSIDKALTLALGTVKSKSLANELRLAIDAVKKGETLSLRLGETRLFPPYFASLLSIGEESGELEKVFTEISERSRTQFYDWVTKFTNLLEPLLILMMGAIVGSVVVIMMLSISSVTDMEL